MLITTITSFFIYGAKFESAEEEVIVRGAESLGFDLDRYRYEGEYDMYELLSDIALEMGFEYFVGHDSECYWLGVSPCKIGDLETGVQFKGRVKRSITKVFGSGIECKYYEEAFKDGQEE